MLSYLNLLYVHVIYVITISVFLFTVSCLLVNYGRIEINAIPATTCDLFLSFWTSDICNAFSMPSKNMDAMFTSRWETVYLFLVLDIAIEISISVSLFLSSLYLIIGWFYFEVPRGNLEIDEVLFTLVSFQALKHFFIAYIFFNIYRLRLNAEYLVFSSLSIFFISPIIRWYSYNINVNIYLGHYMIDWFHSFISSFLTKHFVISYK